MDRTTVMFPLQLKRRAMTAARRRKISFAEFVRKAVEQAAPAPPRKKPNGEDSFWSDLAVYDGPVPPDISINHDKYLHDEPES